MSPPCAHTALNDAFYARIEGDLAESGQPFAAAVYERLFDDEERRRLLCFLGVAPPTAGLWAASVRQNPTELRGSSRTTTSWRPRWRTRTWHPNCMRPIGDHFWAKSRKWSHAPGGRRGRKGRSMKAALFDGRAARRDPGCGPNGTDSPSGSVGPARSRPSSVVGGASCTRVENLIFLVSQPRTALPCSSASGRPPGVAHDLRAVPDVAAVLRHVARTSRAG